MSALLLSLGWKRRVRVCEVIHSECCHDITSEISEAVSFPAIETTDPIDTELYSTLNEQFHTLSTCDVDGTEV